VALPTTTRDLCSEAAEELGVVQKGDSLDDSDADLMLRRYNRLLDFWNATRGAVYADQFVDDTLTPALAPHTIGPTGTFVVTQRPVVLDGASLWVSSDVKRPIVIRDKQWWDDQRVPTLSTSFPTDVFYNPTFPNGELNFWPIPDTAYDVQLFTRIVLAQVTLDTSFSLPPAYWRAHVLTLAEEAAPAFGTTASDATTNAAKEARKAVWGNNTPIPRLATRDLGMPKSGTGTRNFNYLDRSFR